jgi:hypothetical protein
MRTTTPLRMTVNGRGPFGQQAYDSSRAIHGKESTDHFPAKDDRTDGAEAGHFRLAVGTSSFHRPGCLRQQRRRIKEPCCKVAHRATQQCQTHALKSITRPRSWSPRPPLAKERQRNGAPRLKPNPWNKRRATHPPVRGSSHCAPQLAFCNHVEPDRRISRTSTSLPTASSVSLVA